jgi:hypothetical protein
MAVGAVGVDTASDEVTQVCLDARDLLVYPTLASLGVTVARLTGPAATTATVLAALTPDVRLLTLSGHGLEDRVLGQAGVLLQAGRVQAAAVRGKIVHLLACKSGSQLGPDLVAIGCAAFFGYSDDFAFPLARSRDFLECDAAIDEGFARGLNADDVFRLAIRRFNRKIAELRQAGEGFRASLLENNRDRLCAPTLDPRWGDPGARL